MLIPNKYNKLIDTKLKYLYEVEDCTDCKSFCSKISKLSKEIKSCDDEFEIDDLKDNLKDLNLNYKNHKKKHTHQFSVKDINYIISLK